MKPKDLVIGKVYVYDNAECLVFDKFPSSGCFRLSTFKFQTVGVPNPKPRWLNAEAVNDLITELEIEKPEVPNFRPDHYTSLPFKLDEVQETIAENCFKATNDFKKALWVSFALKHLGRLGLKDDVTLELKKAENYLHKARTGEWLSD